MKDLFKDIKDELNIIEQELEAFVKTPNRLITDTATYLLKSGGKRLRPAFTILAGKFADFAMEKVLPLAMALELTHMATLIHDDVVDRASTRRGALTVRAIRGSKLSVHIGDFLFARSLILISRYDNPLISRVLADTSVKMCEGEIYQISAPYNIKQTIKDYFYTIYHKTALLISASCQLGAVACEAPENIYQSLRRYGRNIGMAFQITDDILDIAADEELLGKPVGGDLRQGIITLPVIYALKYSPFRERLKSLVIRPDKDSNEIKEAIGLIKDCGAIDFSKQVVKKYVNRARSELAGLPDREAKKTLALITDFISTRKF